MTGARVTGTMEGMIRRALREVAYCAISAAHGVAGLFFLAWWVVPSAIMSVTVLGTLPGLLLLIGALRAARLMGTLQRWFLARVAGMTVDPPPPPPSGRGGVALWLQDQLSDRAGWRAVGYLAARLPLMLLQSATVAFVLSGAIDFLYPVFWTLVHPHAGPGGGPGAVRVLSPFPMGGLSVSTWPGAFAATAIGAGFLAVAVALARCAVRVDAWLAGSLLGPGALTDRVRELERTRSLAVDSAAEALRQVERDLHDGAQVRLAALAMHLGMAREKAAASAPDLEALRELLATADTEARGALSELRDLARGIHPPVLDNGLADALASLAAASALPVTVSVPGGLPRPSAAIETIAYFCASELLANAGKHSFANSASVSVSAGDPPGTLRLRVADDGVGGADPARGSGLNGLAERVAVVDGALNVSSPPGGPTVVTVELPMEA